MSDEVIKKPRRSFTFDDVKAHAEKLGGKCLSKKYVNSTYKMLFECKVIHRWKASPLDIFGKKNKKGSWCPKCQDKESYEL